MRVALVYDRVNKFGGAERVLLALHKIWPSAPLYTSVYDSKGAPWAKDFQVIPSFINKIPLARKYHEAFPWLMPLAFESFTFDKFDMVISLTSAEAKGLITQPKTLHLCYCLTPTRYLWSSYDHYLNHPRYGFFNPLARLLMRPMLARLKNWDRIAGQRPDVYAAISQTVKHRIKKYYHRDSKIIFPPVDTKKFYPSPITHHPSPKYFLVVSRLVSYKKIDIIIDAFNQLGLPLKIIGDGRERKYLEQRAKRNIEFLGQELTDEQLLGYYQNCSALVFAGVEDFGLVSLEAQSCGKAVIAYKMGGVGETVINRRTGILFDSQNRQALIKALKNFKVKQFSPKNCRQNAEKFKEEVFIKEFKHFAEDKWQQHQKLI